MRILFLFIIVITVLSSCVEKSQTDSVDEQLLDKFSRMRVELIKPNDFIIDGNYLIIHDAGSHVGYIKVVDVQNDTIVNELLPHGQGPDDALAVSSMSISGNCLYVFDNMKERITVFSLDSIETGGKKKFEYEQSWPKSNNVLCFTTSRDRYFISKWKQEEKFTILDKNLCEKGRGGLYLPSPSESYDSGVLSMADAGKFYISPNQKHLVDIVFKACAISCYRIINDSLLQEWKHLLEPYNYTSDGFVIESQGNLGYKSVAMTDSFIYALYCGKPMNSNSWATSASVIHVYDYNGSLVKKFLLPEPALRICISPDGKNLYTLSYDVEPSVCIYHLD